MGNAYMRVARLATHPAFSWRTGALQCPLCRESFATVGTYTPHLLAHQDLTEQVGYRFLDARTWAKTALARGWDAEPVALAECLPLPSAAKAIREGRLVLSDADRARLSDRRREQLAARLRWGQPN